MSSASASDSDGPAAYHTNLANLLPTLNLPPPLTGMSRLRAIALRQQVGHLDVLGVLAKVVMRPHPVINLGPIGEATFAMTLRNSKPRARLSKRVLTSVFFV